eukprot:354463-Chlamydomonas_euryale.AAC.6
MHADTRKQSSMHPRSMHRSPPGEDAVSELVHAKLRLVDLRRARRLAGAEQFLDAAHTAPAVLELGRALLERAGRASWRLGLGRLRFGFLPEAGRLGFGPCSHVATPCGRRRRRERSARC